MKNEQFCQTCIRECSLGNSYCGRRGEKSNLIDKNRYCALLVDQLFDKPIVHFSKNIKILSIGSWGCNLRCLGCQNAHLSWTNTGEGVDYVELHPDNIVKMALKSDCQGICYTYNEPAILLEEVEEIALKAKNAGLFNIFVTNSTLTTYSTKRISPLMSAVGVDIKSMDDEFYYQYCGAQGINDIALKILNCIQAFYDSGCHVEVRTNIINGANDQEVNLKNIAHWIKSNLGEQTPWHITRFFPAYKLNHIDQTPTKVMLKAQQFGLDEGLKHVHTYFTKGCDCAKDKCMVDSSNKDGEIVINSCCD